MYKVIKLFADLQDKNHVYTKGDTFPREGLEVTEERIKELAGSNNKQGTPLIKLVEELPAENPEELPAENPEEVPAENPEEVPAGESVKKGTRKAADK